MSDTNVDPLSAIPPLDVIAEQLREADDRAARLRVLYKTALKIKRAGANPVCRVRSTATASR